MIKFTIPGEPRTKKNSQRIIKVNGHYAVIPSKAYKDYESHCKKYMPAINGINYPVNLKCIFFMQTRRRVDLVNLQEAICDILTHYKVIEDDNYKIVNSMDGSRVDYDKEHPRCEITIERIDTDG